MHDPSNYILPLWQRVELAPVFQGLIKQSASDFRVTEMLGYALTGAGEHDFLWLEKENENTAWVAGKLAGHAGIRELDVGYSGRKDRHAITQQWFSIRRPTGEGTDWEQFSAPGVKILQQSRHDKKLRRGAHSGNHFRIAIRSDDSGDIDEAVVNDRLESIRERGVPNYFGVQRFGRNGSNLSLALALFSGRRLKRNKRSVALSAARAFLFNHVLQQRVKDETWNHAIAGEVFNLDGTGSVFSGEEVDEKLLSRLAALDIHPTGPLWGTGELLSSSAAEKIESDTLAPFGDFTQGLQQEKVNMARRALRLAVRDLQWEFAEGALWVEFSLTSGGFATSVLREITAENL